MESDFEDRTAENHPRERWYERGGPWHVQFWRYFIHHKLWRDFWLFFITILVLFALEENGDRIKDIQSERSRSITVACVNQNERNINTKNTLNEIYARRREEADTRKEVRQLQQSRAATILLINALSPMRDCEELVKRSVNPDID